MRIIYISDYLFFGGAEMQNRREALAMASLGHNVLILTFDINAKGERMYGCALRNITLNKTNKINLLFPNLVNSKRIRNIIKSFKPDVVRINNINNNVPTVFKAVKGYTIIQTLRDFSSVCPNGFSIHMNNFKKCYGFESKSKCINCLKNNNGWLKAHWKYLCFKKNLARRKIPSISTCPSNILTKYANNIGIKTICLNNPFDFSLIQTMKSKGVSQINNKVFFYYGLIGFHKGIRELIEAFTFFASKQKNAKLHLAGKIDSVFKKEFDLLIANNKAIEYLGVLTYLDTLSYLANNVYCVVVPSLWMENYPNTILEAQSLKRVVIASDRGGMSEMICDDRFIFDVLNIQDFVSKFEFASSMSKNEYELVTNKAYNRIIENNSLDKYIKAVDDLLINL